MTKNSFIPLLEKYKKYENVMESSSFNKKKSEVWFTPLDPSIDSSRETVYFTCTQDKVKVDNIFKWHADDPEEKQWLEEHEMTHEKCFEYLDQLPKPWYKFTTSVSYPEANEND